MEGAIHPISWIALWALLILVIIPQMFGEPTGDKSTGLYDETDRPLFGR